jgi:hypothetical protein
MTKSISSSELPNPYSNDGLTSHYYLKVLTKSSVILSTTEIIRVLD